ncbi:MAG: TetR/AcrR family transcriptional regulator [Acetobacteraceae bacterium]|nr:TetR/AcrR family transcriptional regulator [Acetobacteraceae bacterium]
MANRGSDEHRGSLQTADIFPVLLPEKRAQIMAGAVEVFASDGYEGASMSRIAQVAGVSKGTLYNYFDSKAALFSAYVNEVCDHKISALFGVIDGHDNPADALRDIGRRMIQLMLSAPSLTIYRVVISEAFKFPELARLFFNAGPARAVRSMADWLDKETRKGNLAVPDPEFAAEQFFALCQTRIVMRRRLNMLDALDPDELDRVVNTSVDMFLGTYRA